MLSTDSGGVGLNLQAASVVINLDLPWNPARLEQRVARAWRKHQTQSVHVVNLISENTIEHSMLARLAAKQTLADGILNGQGDPGELRMPTAAGAKFIDQVQILLSSSLRPTAPARPPLPPEARLAALARRLFADALVEVRLPSAEAGHAAAALVLLKEPPDAAVAATLLHDWQQSTSALKDAPAHLEVVDIATWNVIQRLAGRGIVRVGESFETLQPAARTDEDVRRARASHLAAEAQRKAKMATLLAASDFATEALAPVREAVEIGLQALVILRGAPEMTDGPISEALLRSNVLAHGLLTEADLDLVTHLRRQPPADRGPGEMVQAAAALAQKLVRTVEPRAIG